MFLQLFVIASLSLVTSFSITRKWAGQGIAMLATALAWLIGITCAVLFAAILRGPGTGVGVAGEHVEASRAVIVAGVWLALMGAGCGTGLGFFSRRKLSQWDNPSHSFAWAFFTGDVWRRLGRHAATLLAAKLIAIAVLLVLAPWGWWPQVVHEVDWMLWFRSWAKMTLYLSIYAIALIGLLTLAFLRNWRVRVPLVALLLVGFAADQCLLSLSGQHMTRAMTEIGMREWRMAGSFFRVHGSTVAVVCLLVALMGLPLCLPLDRHWSIAPFNAVYPVASLLLMGWVLYASRGEVDAFPSPYSVYTHVLVASLSSASGNAMRRE